MQALSQDYQLLFRHPKASSKGLPWRKPKPIASYDSIVKKTLFGLEYLSVRNVRFPCWLRLVEIHHTQVFDLYKIRHLYIDGQMSYDNRAKVITKFNEDPTIRVLFFTSVGATGLNLTIASVVILLVRTNPPLQNYFLNNVLGSTMECAR